MLYHSSRPSEACQLKVKDILQGELPCIHFSDSDENQKLKNAASKRVIPIPQKLLGMGFLTFVKQRQGRKQLFHIVPKGGDKDSSKNFRDAFGDVLDAVGFKVGKRANIQEHLVYQIVAHQLQNMTYGRYGKRLEAELLVDAVNQFKLDFE